MSPDVRGGGLLLVLAPRNEGRPQGTGRRGGHLLLKSDQLLRLLGKILQRVEHPR